MSIFEWRPYLDRISSGLIALSKGAWQKTVVLCPNSWKPSAVFKVLIAWAYVLSAGKATTTKIFKTAVLLREFLLNYNLMVCPVFLLLIFESFG
jgi:hypothetical protein